jgi:hypothetical protein
MASWESLLFFAVYMNASLEAFGPFHSVCKQNSQCGNLSTIYPTLSLNRVDGVVACIRSHIGITEQLVGQLTDLPILPSVNGSSGTIPILLTLQSGQSGNLCPTIENVQN